LNADLLDLSIEVEDVRIMGEESRTKLENMRIGKRNWRQYVFPLHHRPVSANKAASTTNFHGGHLQPLRDIRTGDEIPAYPQTLANISHLDAFEAERILRALQQEPMPAALSDRRERIRQLTTDQI